MSGAGERHLASCLRAPYADFKGHMLDDSKFKLSWRHIFSEAKFTEKSLDFPLSLAPCQVERPFPF
jgi:hypothetical protein